MLPSTLNELVTKGSKGHTLSIQLRSCQIETELLQLMGKIAGYWFLGTCNDYLLKQVRKIPGKLFFLKESIFVG
jgi:hypothetical protein